MLSSSPRSIFSLTWNRSIFSQLDSKFCPSSVKISYFSSFSGRCLSPTIPRHSGELPLSLTPPSSSSCHVLRHASSLAVGVSFLIILPWPSLQRRLSPHRRRLSLSPATAPTSPCSHRHPCSILPLCCLYRDPHRRRALRLRVPPCRRCHVSIATENLPRHGHVESISMPPQHPST